ncbi:hydrogenase nickel incorporation protein HypB [Ciceribacter ferrooxidans]|uniref:Hydrogenase maturation factor HypB n=1 Tax=Ciceribacter ferrooxidans TaxID=2509717 RepID=A0A4Q2TDQ2_9HYPH|nr:hydrogenase nickel incorporation protein HypB [Ciceribacter ferrooxidans]RYC17432.1 hydrogenase nickel incorporation protein HypB [Ciceribacter ferrooxidans]
MCTVCGCGTEPVVEKGHAHAHGHGHGDHHDDHHHDHDDHHAHAHPHGDGHSHDHEHQHEHGDEGVIHYGQGIAGVHVPGMSQERIIQVERDILSKNDGFAAENRAYFAANGIFALNFVSSPGSGKTSLLVRTISDLRERLAIGVVEGDQQTSNDAARIRETGAPAIQVNTGKGCHLDAHMVGHAVEELAPAKNSVLFIENVGNLVCPAAFDLGEAHKVVLLSVTEGEDKPLKYPDMFAAADLMILNKADLLPHLYFDVGACIANALRVNPRLQTLVVSARTGEGMPAFYSWLEANAAMAVTRALAKAG